MGLSFLFYLYIYIYIILNIFLICCGILILLENGAYEPLMHNLQSFGGLEFHYWFFLFNELKKKVVVDLLLLMTRKFGLSWGSGGTHEKLKTTGETVH